uniref:Orf154b n=1 Tax=Batis maritima TaxID=4436 RepID=A0A068BE24_BATMA|nr:orf154b [Batis maritima]AIC83321.1 orf154b [Batis maritima]
MCFHIVSFSAQVVESLKGFGQEYRRQVVPEVVHAHLEELLLSKLLGTGKSKGSNLAVNSMTGSLSLCLVLSCSGTPTLLCVLLNCFLNSETLASQVGIDSSERWAYHVKAGPYKNCTKSLRHSAPFCATGPHLDRKCARSGCGSPVPSNILKSG